MSCIFQSTKSVDFEICYHRNFMLQTQQKQVILLVQKCQDPPLTPVDFKSKGHHQSYKLHQICQFFMGFHMVPLPKRRVWRFFRAGPNGPSPPTHFGSNSSSKFQFWAIEGSLGWLSKEFCGIEGSVDWFLRPLFTIQAFCCLNF